MVAKAEKAQVGRRQKRQALARAAPRCATRGDQGVARRNHQRAAVRARREELGPKAVFRFLHDARGRAIYMLASLQEHGVTRSITREIAALSPATRTSTLDEQSLQRSLRMADEGAGRD